MRCDGSPIPSPSPWEGFLTPNLNGEGRFLRGGNPDQVLSFQDDMFLDHDHSITDPGHGHTDAGNAILK